MAKYYLTYKSYGQNALLIEWPEKIDLDILEEIILFQKIIETQLEKDIIEFIPAFNSLTIIFKPEKIALNELLKKILNLNPHIEKKAFLERKRWYIPVCYDPDFGADLELIAMNARLTIPEVIDIHGATSYTVFFIGFLPGFLYLGGLPEILHVPRKATPTRIIAKGSVAIGGGQAGIYPQESPGGWNIIGRTPVELFDYRKDPPCFAKPGDLVLFNKIEKDKFLILESLIKAGEYKIKMDLPDL
jgi:inhibitor of KinA